MGLMWERIKSEETVHKLCAWEDHYMYHKCVIMLTSSFVVSYNKRLKTRRESNMYF